MNQEVVVGLLEKSREVLTSTLKTLESGNLEELEHASQALQDLNSSFPDTQQFLQSRGVRNVGELSEAERGELINYLLDVFLSLKKQ